MEYCPLNFNNRIQPSKKDVTTAASVILKDAEDNNEYHFHDVDRKWIIDAMVKYSELRLKNS
jgi:hypothetical protein